MNARKLLEIIDDGEWHSLTELAEKLKVPLNIISQTIDSLSKCGVVKNNGNTNKVKLASWVSNLHGADIEEPKTAIGLIIIPPKGYVTIQNALISNFTEDAIELIVRMDKKLKEISISKVKLA